MILLSNNIKKRIDSLGRIVLPKQIREELKINDFDELNISVEKDCILLKKTICIGKYKEKIDRLLKLLKKIYDFSIIIIDNECVVSSNNDSIVCGDALIDFNYNYNYKNELVNLNFNKKNNVSVFVILENLILDSNLLGYMIVFSKEILNVSCEEINCIKKLILDLV